MPDGDGKPGDGTYTRYFSRYHVSGKETFDSFERAVEASYWADEGGFTSTNRIEGPDGEVLFDQSDYRGGILEFAEDEGYVEVDDD